MFDRLVSSAGMIDENPHDSYSDRCVFCNLFYCKQPEEKEQLELLIEPASLSSALVLERR